MVKDLEYFLEQENRYCEEHPNYGKLFFDEKIGEMSIVGVDDHYNFLTDRVISKHLKYIEKFQGDEHLYNLTDSERVVLRLLYCQHSYLFRDDYYYEGVNEVAQSLFDTLDSLIKKAPQNKNNILFRNCNEYDPVSFEIGDFHTFPWSLTCTNYDWGQEKCTNVYVISPLKEGRTKAHNLFEIYEHGDEKQVNFLRGSSFVVTNVEPTAGTIFKKIYMDEV